MNKTQPHRYNREEMLQLINACRTSGFTDAEWCR